MKAIIKILIVLLIANALWRVASAYISHYRFEDAVLELATRSTGKTSSEQLKDKVMELAATYDEPVDADAVAIRREEHHTYIDSTYKKPILLFPWYEYQWPFTLSVDGFVVVPVKLGDLTNPK